MALDNEAAAWPVNPGSGAEVQPRPFLERSAFLQLTVTRAREFYRHTNLCNVLWMDGHVSGIYKSNGTDVPKTKLPCE